ncbi:MAG: S8 family serine peptidase, partial [Firmicutes bacterium]|nr:S8 family serine peptidase [Bacillota bacterium]
MPNNIDSALMAAFGLTRQQLEETDELQIGFMPEEDRFEVVVRYNGELGNILRQIPGARGEALTGRYAILTLTEEQIFQIADLPQIEYVEKPKALLASDVGALRASCIPTVQLPTTYDLHGAGTLVGIMDSGIDYMHPAFITPEGESRIAALWDQTLDGEQFFTKEQITTAIRSSDPYSVVPSRDTLGHGTQVAGIAAGNGRGGDGRIKGVADQAELIVVKLTENPGYGFSKTTSAMRALKYIIETAQAMGKPVAVNVSMGTNMGGHDGQSLFESYIDDWSTRWLNSLVIAVGNEGNAARHTSGVLTEGEQDKIEVNVGEGRSSILFQIWKEFADRFYINVTSPSGQNTGFVRDGSGAFVTIIDGTQVLIYFGEPNPYSGASTIFINLFSEGTVRPGLWSIYLQGASVLDGEYNIWMTGVDGNRGDTYFLTPDVQTTITMPVTARSVLGVTAYNHVTGAIAPFSGQGYSRTGQIIRPDLAAPGVDVLTAVSGGGYGEASGTSIAAPFVTGAAALLMEWGIV